MCGAQSSFSFRENVALTQFSMLEGVMQFPYKEGADLGLFGHLIA